MIHTITRIEIECDGCGACREYEDAGDAKDHEWEVDEEDGELCPTCIDKREDEADG